MRPYSRPRQRLVACLALVLALAGAGAWAQTSFVLRIQGSPTNYGAPTPLGYGAWTNIADDTWLTNTVASPTNFTSTARRACIGWTAAYTNGDYVITNSSTQAVFKLTNNVVLTWFWTNEYYLTLTAGTNGSLVEDKSGWYTNGTQVVIAATGNTGYAFSQWTGDVPSGGHTNNPLTVAMTQARVMRANFASLTPQTKIWTGTANWTNATNWSSAGMPGPADTAVITSGTVTVSEPVWVGTLTNSATLTFSGWSNVLTAVNVVVPSGGKITHAANTATTTNDLGQWVPNAGVFLECSNLTVQSGGLIEGNVLGYAGGTAHSGYGPGKGEYNPSSWAGGGAYGGAGGYSAWAGGGTAYGSLTAPADPGSGGAGNGAGGAGGGYISILASGTITMVEPAGLTGGTPRMVPWRAAVPAAGFTCAVTLWPAPGSFKPMVGMGIPAATLRAAAAADGSRFP